MTKPTSKNRHHGADHVQLGADSDSIRFHPKPQSEALQNWPAGFVEHWDKLQTMIVQDKVPHDYQAAIAQHKLILLALEECLESHVWVQNIEHHLDLELDRLVALTGGALALSIKRMQDALQGRDAETNDHAARYGKAMLNDHWLKSPLFARSFEKPCGYAGDYLLMHRIYRQDDEAPTLMGRILNRFYLALPVVLAGYNRIPFLVRLLHAEILAQKKSAVRMASLACGPGQELVDLFEKPLNPGQTLSISLLDQDLDALDFCTRRHQQLRAEGRLPDAVTLEYFNVAVKLILKETANLHQQIGSFDIFYAVGLFDYLPHDVGSKLVSALLSLLNPGGLLVVGNFTHHDAMTMMDHLADWPLRYRTGEELLALAGPALRHDPKHYEAQIVTEETGLMLFLTVRKAAE